MAMAIVAVAQSLDPASAGLRRFHRVDLNSLSLPMSKSVAADSTAAHPAGAWRRDFMPLSSRTISPLPATTLAAHSRPRQRYRSESHAAAARAEAPCAASPP